MIKDKLSMIVNNLKLSRSSFKISLNTIKRFSILTINNKYIKIIFILWSLFKILVNNIEIFSYSSY